MPMWYLCDTVVISLRRIHRQKGVDPYKDSTMRLRDGAITVEDDELWLTHEVPSLDPKEGVPWFHGERLLREGLVLVPENAPAGRVNGRRLAEGAPLALEPGSASSQQVAVRCEARHNKARGEIRKAEEFRSARKVLHLCVGAQVMLGVNKIWDASTSLLALRLQPRLPPRAHPPR